MKKFFFSLATLLMCSSVVSYADNVKLWANDFTVGAGQVATVKIYLANAPTCSGLDISFDLPEGVYLLGYSGKVYKEEGDIDPADYSLNDIITTGGAAGFSFTPDFYGEGSFCLSPYTNTDNVFGSGPQSAEGTWILSFDVISEATTPVTGSLKFYVDPGVTGSTQIANVSPGEEGFDMTEEAEVIVSDKFIVKLPSSGVATICSLVDLDMTGLDAYYVKEIVDKKVKGVKIDGALKALEGAVIQGEAGSVIEIPVATSEAAAPEKNMLVGVTKFTKIGGEGIYFMSGGKFKKAAANGTLAAGKAYLDASKAAKGFDELEFVVEDDATAIKAIETEQNAGVLYNLNGVRVDNPTKGVYIQNGRKVVVK